MRHLISLKLLGLSVLLVAGCSGRIVTSDDYTLESGQTLRGDLTGKKALVFCTYKLAVGPTLQRMTQGLEQKGAQVVAQFKYRGPMPGNEFAAFAASLTSVPTL